MVQLTGGSNKLKKKWFKLHLDWQCLAVASVMRLSQTRRMCTSPCSEKAGTTILLYPRSSSNRSIRRPKFSGYFFLGKLKFYSFICCFPALARPTSRLYGASGGVTEPELTIRPGNIPGHVAA